MKTSDSEIARLDGELVKRHPALLVVGHALGHPGGARGRIDEEEIAGARRRSSSSASIPVLGRWGLEELTRRRGSVSVWAKLARRHQVQPNGVRPWPRSSLDQGRRARRPWWVSRLTSAVAPVFRSRCAISCRPARGLSPTATRPAFSVRHKRDVHARTVRQEHGHPALPAPAPGRRRSRASRCERAS